MSKSKCFLAFILGAIAGYIAVFAADMTGFLYVFFVLGMICGAMHYGSIYRVKDMLDFEQTIYIFMCTVLGVLASIFCILRLAGYEQIIVVSTAPQSIFMISAVAIGFCMCGMLLAWMLRALTL